jgi:hypothetical protein
VGLIEKTDSRVGDNIRLGKEVIKTCMDAKELSLVN